MWKGRVYPVRMCVCVFQTRVWPITSSCMVVFENNLAQNLMIIVTRQYVMNKSHIARSKVKATVQNLFVSDP